VHFLLDALPDAANRARVSPRAVLIGIGNEQRGDDALGPVVAREVRKSAPEAVEVLVAPDASVELIDAWHGARTLILVDAVHSGSPPGTLHRFDASGEPLPALFSRHSTHAFSVAELIELARAIGQLPERVWVLGIEGAGYDHNQPLSDDVQQALPSLIETIAQLLA